MREVAYYASDLLSVYTRLGVHLATASSGSGLNLRLLLRVDVVHPAL